MLPNKLIQISEKVWRAAASQHQARIESLLLPGLVSSTNGLVGQTRVQRKRKLNHDDASSHEIHRNERSTAGLDPMHPVYNFLVEYYGIKGSKGVRRLARWSPDPSWILLSDDDIICQEGMERISHSTIYQAAMEASHGLGGILLENANENDMGDTLHLKGSIPVLSSPVSETEATPQLYGILYNPALYYRHRDQDQCPSTAIDDVADEHQNLQKTLAPFEWYASILQTTLQSEPVFHCHGLHEWAMLYRPQGAPEPPSTKYQPNLPLRVSQNIINQAVERKGISCTHVDALRYFAPAAKPLNHQGGHLERMDQLRLEQKACVHAHMDLLKIALKISPFLDADLLGDVLEVSLEARKLDMEASPYDATAYGFGIVPVETPEGRKMYRERQKILMERAEPVRKRLLKAYETFMVLAFGKELHSV